LTAPPPSGDNLQQPPPKAPRRPRALSRKTVTRIAVVVGALVLVGGGFAAGLAVGRSPIAGYQQQIAQASRNLNAEQLKLSNEKVTLQVERGQVQAAQTAAKNAMSAALAQVKAQYKSKLASVQALQRKLLHEQGIIQASTISADGVYVIGKDIPAGTYHTSGGSQCYYALLGSTDTSNIIDNNIVNGPATVDLSSAYAFDITGGCIWHKVG
jgi:hypothetical protein